MTVKVIYAENHERQCLGGFCGNATRLGVSLDDRPAWFLCANDLITRIKQYRATDEEIEFTEEARKAIEAEGFEIP